MKILEKVFNFIFSRVFLVALMLVLQLSLILFLFIFFSQSSIYVYALLNIISALVAIWLINKDLNADFKITWIVLILTFPIVGGACYILFANPRISRKLRKKMDSSEESIPSLLPNKHVMPKNEDNISQAKYVTAMSHYPVFDNTEMAYYSVGEKMFDAILEEMENAEKYICTEFFIVEPGQMLDRLLNVLERKAKQGVEVYFMYDDLGSIMTLSNKYNQLIRDKGIKLVNFNPFRPHLSILLNNRDHRKIVSIDGKVAFCGGINLADEYINVKKRLGHWKDTGVMMKGEAAWALTVMFLQMWQFAIEADISFEKFKPKELPSVKSSGYLHIFGDTPLDGHNITETVYLKAIHQAKDYIYIVSPYLVIDKTMEDALCMAAASGVDVRLITPNIYDKWYVHVQTKARYPKLIKAGVKIYEYTPGFIHSKMFVSDDEICVVGTSNMDFRSFYLHFECNVLMYENEIAFDVKKDIMNCFEISHLVTLEESQALPLYIRIFQAIFKLFSPLF